MSKRGAAGTASSLGKVGAPTAEPPRALQDSLSIYRLHRTFFGSQHLNMMHRRNDYLQLLVFWLCLQSVSAFLWNQPWKSGGIFKHSATKTNSETLMVFHDFVTTLQRKQSEIIEELEKMDGSGEKFTNDTWGCFVGEERSSGGITRVLQGGDVIEKGACSFTLIQQGVLSNERANAIRSRQGAKNIQSGDTYSASALSIVLHSRSPLVPTFRSDVRIFLVETNGGLSIAWFGGGADLTPYYLFEDDISGFHCMYRDVCNRYELAGFTYESMKEQCDKYFFLPARAEHRGTGGIFFDDLEVTAYSSQFVEAIADTFLPSWLQIVERHRNTKTSEKQRQWQLLRRGRYLEWVVCMCACVFFEQFLYYGVDSYQSTKSHTGSTFCTIEA